MPFDAYRLILATTLGLGLTGPAFAQETPAPAAPEATEPPAPSAESETPPAVPGTTPETQTTDGNPAANEPREIVRDTFGDWQVRCATVDNECFMYQLALDTSNNPVAEVSLVKLPQGGEAAAGVTVVSPLGTLLTTGVALQVDTNDARQYPFNWCSQVGCFARFGLATDSVDSMKRGKAAKLSLVSIAAPNRPITLDLSLNGFTAAYNSLETPTAAPMAPGATPAAPPPPPQPTMPSLAPTNN